MRAKCEAWRGYPILGGCYEPFYLYCRLRGMEQALADLALNPAVAEAALEHIYYIHESFIRRTLEAASGLIDFIYVAEDLGTQDTLLMSPASFRRFLKPWMRKMIDLAHSFGVKVMHHDDGAIRPLLPELIEIGIDVLNPIQWRCAGMGREELARDFGKSLVFHGGVDNQQTLPFGTPDDVKREVAENIRIFSKGKGYIVAPAIISSPTRPRPISWRCMKPSMNASFEVGQEARAEIGGIPSGIEQANKGIISIDLNDRLKRIEKLPKQLRRELFL